MQELRTLSGEIVPTLEYASKHALDVVMAQSPVYRGIAGLLAFAAVGLVWRILKLSFTKLPTDEDRLREQQAIMEREKRRYTPSQ